MASPVFSALMVLLTIIAIVNTLSILLYAKQDKPFLKLVFSALACVCVITVLRNTHGQVFTTGSYPSRYDSLANILESGMFNIKVRRDKGYVFIEDLRQSPSDNKTPTEQTTNKDQQECGPNMIRLRWEDAEALSQKLSIPRLNPNFYLKDSRV